MQQDVLLPSRMRVVIGEKTYSLRSYYVDAEGLTGYRPLMKGYLIFDVHVNAACPEGYCLHMFQHTAVGLRDCSCTCAGQGVSVDYSLGEACGVA